MSEWREVILEDLCTRVSSGGTPKRSNPDFYAESPAGHRWVKSQELRDSSVWETQERISELGLARSSAKLYPAETVLVAMYGATVGQVGYLRVQAALNQAICGLVVDRDVADPRFVFYALRNARAELIAGAAGAAQQNLNQGHIRAFGLVAPSAATQRRIGDVLGAIDDLIENNRQRIALLERIAQVIYREWFVRFRYPGHEVDELVDSSLGPIPVGWEVGQIEDVCSYLNRGIAPKYAEDGGSFVVNQRCIRNGRLDMALARRQERSVPSEKQLRFGDVLINSTGEGTLGRVAQVYSDMSEATVDTHVSIARRAEGVNVDWFGLTVMAKKADFEALAVGSTGQTELGRSAIGSTPVLVAPSKQQSSFGEVVAPLRFHARSLTASENSLVAIRDRVLPRLVTGAIDVSDLDLDALLEEPAA